MTDIIMPKAGMAMETGKIVKWLVQEGDSVNAGDMILEIETDKVNMEVEAFASGTVLKLIGEPGDEVPVTQVIGYIGEPGELVPEAAMAAPPATAKNAARPVHKTAEPAAQLARGAKIPATPLAKTLCRERGIDIATLKASGVYGQVKAADVPEAAQAAVKATPLARAIAQDKGVEIARIGAQGRVWARDVEAAIEKAQAAQSAKLVLAEGDTEVPLGSMRKTIARRMFESHITVPPVTLHTRVNVSGLLAHRKKINENGSKISINDFVIEACAMCLRDMPEANVSFGGDSVIRHAHVNIGVAVALEGGGLVVPVICDADKKPIADLSSAMKDLAGRARSGALAPDEYTGGTFTISNLGMMGITYFTPIINPPESMILGVNAVEQVISMREDGSLFNRDMMGLSLTFDHRAHDGAGAALFLQHVVRTLERFNEGKGQQ